MKKITRRDFIRTGAAAVGTMAVPSVLSQGWFALPAKAAESGYFEREFGITDGLCRKVLAEALAKGGDFADLYFEHTISNYLMLEDGQVNRAASREIALGVGIRTVKGDQVGYGFTQELRREGDARGRLTAATIADAKAKRPGRRVRFPQDGELLPHRRPPSPQCPSGSKLPIVQFTEDLLLCAFPPRDQGQRHVPRPAEADHGRDERRCQGRGLAAADRSSTPASSPRRTPGANGPAGISAAAGSSPSTRRHVVD